MPQPNPQSNFLTIEAAALELIFDDATNGGVVDTIYDLCKNGDWNSFVIQRLRLCIAICINDNARLFQFAEMLNRAERTMDQCHDADDKAAFRSLKVDLGALLQERGVEWPNIGNANVKYSVTLL